MREVLGWMASEGGAMRGEWDGDNGASRKDVFWVYWKRPEDWGQRVWEWVDAVGQRGVVLTVYELLYGEGTVGQGEAILLHVLDWDGWTKEILMGVLLDFHEMDPELFTKALNTLVKKGKAQVFGDADSRGVKFF